MRTTAKMITMASTLILAAACTFGQKGTPSAAGMRILATAPSGQVRRGELLATRDAGVVFLDPCAGLVFARFSTGVDVRNVPGGPTVRITGQPRAADLERLRTQSRYPLGLTDGTLTRLLAALDQAQLEVWP
jgi:hypothetical protein